MALSKKERVLFSFWNAEEHSTLTADLKNVALEGTALDSSRLYLTVTFEFVNTPQCMAELKKADAAAF